MRWSLSRDKTNLEKLIDIVEARMLESEVDSDEYANQMAKLEKLYEIKDGERRSPVSKDTVAVCVTNLLGILMIVAYENRHVMTSKGFSQLIRAKIPHQQ